MTKLETLPYRQILLTCLVGAVVMLTPVFALVMLTRGIVVGEPLTVAGSALFLIFYVLLMGRDLRAAAYDGAAAYGFAKAGKSWS